METPMFDCDLDHISFAEWLIALNACAIKAGYTGSQPFVSITGQLCWYPNYINGLSPDEAIQQMEQDAIRYGELYCFELN